MIDPRYQSARTYRIAVATLKRPTAIHPIHEAERLLTGLRDGCWGSSVVLRSSFSMFTHTIRCPEALRGSSTWLLVAMNSSPVWRSRTVMGPPPSPLYHSTMSVLMEGASSQLSILCQPVGQLVRSVPRSPTLTIPRLPPFKLSRTISPGSNLVAPAGPCSTQQTHRQSRVRMPRD